MLWFCFAISDAHLLVESQLCGIVFPKDLFGAFGQLSTALLIPSGFSGRRFKTAPDLSFQSAEKRRWQKVEITGNQRFRMATNKAFKADS
uniref:hypothetical protein n=1 Tax=Vibrio salilacus TaxID=1323749 RepID=UPI0012FD8DC0